MNNHDLKAMRIALGISLDEAASLPAINVTRRTFQYYESGERAFKRNVEHTFESLAFMHKITVEKLIASIRNNYPDTPKLPIYEMFEDFSREIKCENRAHWYVYRSASRELVLKDLASLFPCVGVCGPLEGLFDGTINEKFDNRARAYRL